MRRSVNGCTNFDLIAYSCASFAFSWAVCLAVPHTHTHTCSPFYLSGGVHRRSTIPSSCTIPTNPHPQTPQPRPKPHPTLSLKTTSHPSNSPPVVGGQQNGPTSPTQPHFPHFPHFASRMSILGLKCEDTHTPTHSHTQTGQSESPQRHTQQLYCPPITTEAVPFAENCFFFSPRSHLSWCFHLAHMEHV